METQMKSCLKRMMASESCNSVDTFFVYCKPQKQKYSCQSKEESYTSLKKPTHWPDIQNSMVLRGVLNYCDIYPHGGKFWSISH